MRTPAFAVLLVCVAACGDATTSATDATTSASDATTSATDATTSTVDGSASTTDATVTDATTTDVAPDVQATFTLATGAVTLAGVCSGTIFDVPFTVTGQLDEGARLEVQLSDEDGAFAENTVIGATTYTGEDGVIAATIPSDALAGTAYRVRMRAPEFGVDADDNGADLTMSGGPHPSIWYVYFPRRFGTIEGDYTAEPDDRDVVAFAWDFGDGAVPRTSTDANPTWAYTTAGHKPILMTATDVLGCTRSDYTKRAIEVFSCDFALRPDFEVLRDSGDELVADSWICAGGDYASEAGSALVVVEPGARYSWPGGGQFAAVVRAGATYVGGSDRDVILYETGATLVDVEGELVACETITFDYSNAPDDGCTSDGPPTIATLGDVGGVCPSAGFDFTFTATGDPAPDNRYLVQLSSDDGTFADPTIIGSLESDGTSGAIPADVPALDGTKTWAARVIATNPAGVGPTKPLSVPVVAEATFDISQVAPFVDESITVSDTTLGAHDQVEWDFGPDAIASTATGSASVRWSTPGNKVVTMRARDASGCPISVEKPVTVVSCTVTLPANTQVVTSPDAHLENPDAPILVCNGASLTVFWSDVTVYVMAGAVATVDGLQGSSTYVEAGAALASYADEGVIVGEPGALVSFASDMRQRECPALTLDASALPVPCPDTPLVPPALTLGDPPEVSCTGDTFEVPYTKTGVFAFDSSLILELSGPNADFVSLAFIQSTLTPTTARVTLPSYPFILTTGTGHRLRLRTTKPVLSATSAPFEIVMATTPVVTASASTVLVGGAVTFATSTSATSYAWTFGDGASVATATGASPPPVTWSTPGKKTVKVTASWDGACPRSATRVVDVHACAPTLPSDVVVATTDGESYDPDIESTWVCDDVSVVGSFGVRTFYLDPGGTLELRGAGTWTVFVPNGATFVYGAAVSPVTIVRAPSATVTNLPASATVLQCPDDITYDASAVATPCP